MDEKMKALDIMVMVGKKDPKMSKPEGKDSEHECKCSCCGAPCEYCNDNDEEDSDPKGAEYTD